MRNHREDRFRIVSPALANPSTPLTPVPSVVLHLGRCLRFVNHHLSSLLQPSPTADPNRYRARKTRLREFKTVPGDKPSPFLQMDWVGYFLFTGALAGLTIGLTWGKNPCKLFEPCTRSLTDDCPRRSLELGACPGPLAHRSRSHPRSRRAPMEVPQGWTVLATHVLQVEESRHCAGDCCHRGCR